VPRTIVAKTEACLRRVALYARVSTDKQSTVNQLRELHQAAERFGWNVAREFVDHGVSGAKSRRDRPQLDTMLKGIARKEFDVVAAWSVDRLGRSLIDLIGLREGPRTRDLGGGAITTEIGKAIAALV
jgi:DNA invertase Pin-like site-specific DNA recombinase